jgi:hypothetical protein
LYYTCTQWEKEIRSLRDLHISYNPLPEFEFVAGNRGSDDYELTLFLQSTQAWRWRLQEELKKYEKNEKKQEDVSKKDANLDEDKSNETKQEVKVVDKSSKSLLFCKRMRGLLPHHCPLKDRMKDKMVSYIDLLRPGPPPSESSKKFAKRK